MDRTESRGHRENVANGPSSQRQALSEPRNRAAVYRLTNVDNEDLSSMGSALQEDRPNNWDFSDWRPSSVFDVKRVKKGNPEREREKEEREREQSLSQESTPQSERHKRRTPSTFPRTKGSLASGTSQSQRHAMENLRQKMSFSDADDASTDGERNNERYISSRRGQRANYAAQDGPTSINDTGAVGGTDGLHGITTRNPNINSVEGPDSNQIVGRLMQIRDYIKQASSMMDKLKKSADPRDKEQRTKLSGLVEHLQDQEKGYMALLEKMLATREDFYIPRLNSGESVDGNSRLESESDVASLELDVQSDTSEATSANLARKNEELEALQQQHDLLKTMLYQQEQLRALQGRQAALLALQQDAERQLAEERALNNEEAATGGATSSAPTSNVDGGGGDGVVSRGIQMDSEDTGDNQTREEEERDLTRRNYLKNLYGNKDQPDAVNQTEEQQSINTESEGSISSVQRRHLRNKLLDLQEKKQHMDHLLQELENMRSQRYQQVNNEMDSASTTSSTRHLVNSIMATEAANETAEEAHDVLEMLEGRKKLKKLQEVRGRLNQLRDLVQYYQSGTEFIHGSDDGYLPDLPTQGLTQGQVQLQREVERASAGQAVQASTSTQDTSDTESQMSSLGMWGDDPEIQEKVRKLKAAKEKLRKLQELVAAVQQSPDMAHSLPDDLAELAASLDGDTNSQASQTMDRQEDPAYQYSDGEVAIPPGNRGEYYEAKMEKQREELEQLVEERRKLLAIQDQLQRLHDQLPKFEDSEQSGAAGDEMELTEKGDTEVKTTSSEGIGVTFGEPLETVISNEDLYNRMRQQRMLREELREKKKELEDMMRKDRPRKQYSRNQDTQSDNVSFSNRSDALGQSIVSGDVTMATWGGSTADNLESIEEDEDGSGEGQDRDDDDDGYPSDGIVQVEEEEEANASDNDTYTIEEDYQARQRGRAAKQRGVGSRHRKGKRTKDTRTRYNIWESGEPEYIRAWPNNIHIPPAQDRLRQQNLHGAEQLMEEPYEECGTDEQLEVFRLQMEHTTEVCERLMEDQRTMIQLLHNMNNQGYGMSVGTPMPPPMFGSAYVSHPLPIHQQQLLLSVNQCLGTLQQQQAEIAGMQHRLDSLYPTAAGRNASRSHDRVEEASPFGTRSSRQMFSTPGLRDQPGQNQLSGRTGRHFDLEPQFPDSFAFLSNPSAYASASQNPLSGTYVLSRQDSGDTSRDHGGDSLNLVPDPDDIQPRRRRTSPPYRLKQNRAKENERKNPYTLPSFLKNLQRQSTQYTQTDLRPQDPSTGPSIQTQTGDERVPKLNLAEVLRPRQRRFGSQAQGSARSASLASNKEESAVIGQKFPTPSRATAAANLASRQHAVSYRPGLSAGISGTANLDAASVSSFVSSVPGGEGMPTTQLSASQRAPPEEPQNTSGLESDGHSDFTMFEALRQTIYAEVATLISQNETRPHFLIELFRELQLLNSDYLRQRALYSLQDLVRKHLTEDSVKQFEKSMPSWMNAAPRGNLSELTPSESMITSEEEEMRAQLLAGNQQHGQSTSHREPGKSDSRPKDGRFDYVEPVETTSSLSTPTSRSSTFSPFAQDSLGDTVIHLDKAMQRMREIERETEQIEQRQVQIKEGATGISVPGQTTSNRRDKDSEGAASSSAQDPGSEDSMSDVPHPRIDTQQLDRQIKSVMTEVIPVLKEHMDDVCSSQLLLYIKRLVLSLTKQRDEGQEFVRFFHKQLGAILQDSLAKFEGRKMRDCGEDLLVDMSEILFNELAFFKLMQDLDEPKKKVRANIREWRQDSFASTDTNATRDAAEQADNEDEDTSEEESLETESEQTTEEEDGDGEAEVEGEEVPVLASVNEEEDLGKARDDELAIQLDVVEEDKDYDSEGPLKSPMKIELAVSETKPFTRIGSDEDDEGDDESQSAEDPSETAVSRDAEKERSSESEAAVEVVVVKQHVEGAEAVAGETVDAADKEVVKHEVEDTEAVAGETVDAADKDGGDPEVANKEHVQPQEGSTERKDEDDGILCVNGEVSGSQEDLQVTLDDLPPQLSSLTKEELEQRMVEEQAANDSAAVNVLEMMGAAGSELAGDGTAIKEPGQ